MNPSTIEIQTKFMYLFERISEPIYFSPRGHGDGRVLFTTPLDRLPPNIARSVIELRKGIPPGQVREINVTYTSVPYDLTHVKVVPRDAIFSPFLKSHRDAAISLLKIFSEQKLLTDFFNSACLCRDEVNCHLWVYALSRAIILRPDMKGFKLPSLCEIMPDRFLNGNILQEARRQARLPEKERAIIVVDRSFSGRDTDAENKLAYFREDIALNAAHWIWHVVYPIDAPPGQRDRKGELFYKMHHDMMARYTTERLGNGLNHTVALNILGLVEEGYFPHLTLENSSLSWGSRQPNTVFKNVDRSADPNTGFIVALGDMSAWITRLMEAIDQSTAVSSTQQTIPLGNNEGIDVLGAMIESSALSPNSNFYGNLHNMGHVVAACAVDPDFRYRDAPGVMATTETAIRDPVFFRWHKYIDDLFFRHKTTLTPYDVNMLTWTGMTISSVGIYSTDRTPNTLTTFFEQRDVDLSRGLDFQRATFNELGPIYARFTHLRHEDFVYRIEVKNNTGSGQIGTVRIFMAPRLDEHQVRIPLIQQHRLFFEMDKFTVSFKPGVNQFERRSVDSSITIPWDQSFEEFERQTQFPTAEQLICGCGWPAHLLLPKGSPQGQDFDVFVMITNWEQDRVRRKNPPIPNDAESETCKQSIGFCGILNELFPDTKPMGYPFDRVPRLDPNGQVFNFLENWMISNSNMKATEVKILHRNVTTVFQGSVKKLPTIRQGLRLNEGKSYESVNASGDVVRGPNTVGYQGDGPFSSPSFHGHVKTTTDWVDLGNQPNYYQRIPREASLGRGEYNHDVGEGKRVFNLY